MGITFTFSDSSTLSSDILIESWNKTEVLYKELKSADNSMRLTIPYNTSLFNKLKAEAGDLIPASVKNANNTTVFSGYVRNTFSYSKAQRNKPMSLELVSSSFKLDVNTTEYHSYSSTTLGAVINALTALAGLTTNISNLTVITLYVIDEDVNIKTAIQQLLFEYGYTYYFDADGVMSLKELFPTIPETPTLIFNGSNCLGEITATKNERKYGGAEITWHEIKEITNEKIYEEENITIPETEYLHNAELVYLEYDSEKGTPIKITSATPEFNWSTSSLPYTFTNYPKRGAISMVNDTSSDKVIAKLLIKGSGFVQSDPLIEVTTLTDGKQNYKFTTNSLSSQSLAQNLARKIADYYRYSLFTITVKTKTNAAIGEYCTVTDDGFGTLKGRIIQKKTNYYAEVYEYQIESVSEYTPATISDSYGQKNYSTNIQGEQGFTGGTDGYQDYQFAYNKDEQVPPPDTPVWEGTMPNPPQENVWYDAPPTWIAPQVQPTDAIIWCRTKYVEGSEDNYALRYQGTWDATNNVPQLSDATGHAGHFYRVINSASRNLGSGAVSWVEGKQITHNGIRWEQSGFDTEGLLGYTPANNNLVPPQASSSNQLSDKNFVNSSIATNTANFLGTNTTATTEADFLAWANALTGKTNNDYVFWQTTDANGNTIYKRYKYSASNTTWVFEYNLNNSSFTSNQWATINSGLTSSDKTKIDGVPSFPLSVANGGTGADDATEAEYNIIGAVGTVTTEPTDNSYLALRNQTVSATNGTFRWTKCANIWEWIKKKIQSIALTIGSTTSAIAETLYGSISVKNSSGTETLKIEQDGTVLGKNIPRFGTFYSSSTYSSGYVLIAQANSYDSSGNHDVSMEGTVYVDRAGVTSISDFFIYARAGGSTPYTAQIIFNCTGRKADADLYATYEMVDTVIKIRLYAKITGNYQRFNTKINYVGRGDVSNIYSNYSSYVAFPNAVYTTLQLGTEISKNTSIIGTATKATQDESGNNIKASYASSLAVSGNNLVLKNKNGTALSTVTLPQSAWVEITLTITNPISSDIDLDNLRAYYNSALNMLTFRGTITDEESEIGDMYVRVFDLTLPLENNFGLSIIISAISVAGADSEWYGTNGYVKAKAGTKQVSIYMRGTAGMADTYTLGNCVIL